MKVVISKENATVRNIYILFHTTETTTMGSPLPTPITTILIACGLISLAYLYKRKKGTIL